MFAQVLADLNGNYDMMDSGSWNWGWVMMLFWLAVIVIVAVLIARSVGGGSSNSGGHNTDDALEIAKKRLARGEINKKEFDEIRKAIKD